MVTLIAIFASEDVVINWHIDILVTLNATALLDLVVQRIQRPPLMQTGLVSLSTGSVDHKKWEMEINVKQN